MLVVKVIEMLQILCNPNILEVFSVFYFGDLFRVT